MMMTTIEYNDREQLRQEIVELRQNYEACRERVNYLLGQVDTARKERDKYRDMAERRQGQFDRLKANFDEVVQQRDDALALVEAAALTRGEAMSLLALIYCATEAADRLEEYIDRPMVTDLMGAALNKADENLPKLIAGLKARQAGEGEGHEQKA